MAVFASMLITALRLDFGVPAKIIGKDRF